MSEDQHVSTGTLPDDFVGAENHGPVPSETIAEAARRSIQSGAWGGAREISFQHGAPWGTADNRRRSIGQGTESSE